jgi:hypothetical protein
VGSSPSTATWRVIDPRCRTRPAQQNPTSTPHPTIAPQRRPMGNHHRGLR